MARLPKLKMPILYDDSSDSSFTSSESSSSNDSEQSPCEDPKHEILTDYCTSSDSDKDEEQKQESHTILVSDEEPEAFVCHVKGCGN